MLDAVRNAIKERIEINPITLVALIRPRKINSQGISVEDITQDAVKTELGIVSVSRRNIPDRIVTNAETPYDYLDSYYLIAEFDASWLRKGLIFFIGNERFRTKLPEDRMMFGDVAYKLCGLESMTSHNLSDF